MPSICGEIGTTGFGQWIWYRSMTSTPSRARAPAVLLDDGRGRHDRQHLGREERLLAAVAERWPTMPPSSRARRSPRCRSRLTPEVERACGGCDRPPVGVLGAVAPVLRPELPRAEPDGRHPNSVDLYESHRRSLRADAGIRSSGHVGDRAGVGGSGDPADLAGMRADRVELRGRGRRCRRGATVRVIAESEKRWAGQRCGPSRRS